jgi:hypothetical protein
MTDEFEQQLREEFSREVEVTRQEFIPQVEICHCGQIALKRTDDPWQGRMDGYCYDCASNRCDCYPDECPVKYPPPQLAVRDYIRRIARRDFSA